MEEALAQQMFRPQLEVEKLQSQLKSRSPVTKDLSLVVFVPKFSDNDKAVPLHEYFEILEITARIGNWSPDDMIKIAILKITDLARHFYNGTLKLHNRNIKWVAFKSAFLIDSETREQKITILRSSKWRERKGRISTRIRGQM